MRHLYFRSFALFFACTALVCELTSCASAPGNPTEKAAAETGAAKVGEIDFSKNSSAISSDAKNKILEIVAASKSKGEIKSVVVAAWSDQEYPAKDSPLPAEQVDLARDRAQNVISYLKLTLTLPGVSGLNMALRPTLVEDRIPTPEAKIKDTFETYGSPPTILGDTKSPAIKGKASKVLIMVYLK